MKRQTDAIDPVSDIHRTDASPRLLGIRRPLRLLASRRGVQAIPSVDIGSQRQGTHIGLTKVNFNACLFGDGLPVTLRFADAVGEILTAAPGQDGPPLPFRHYI